MSSANEWFIVKDRYGGEGGNLMGGACIQDTVTFDLVMSHATS